MADEKRCGAESAFARQRGRVLAEGGAKSYPRALAQPDTPKWMLAFQPQSSSVHLTYGRGLLGFAHFDLEAEVVDTVSIAQRLLKIDLAIHIQIKEGHVESLTPFLRPLFHRLFHSVHLALLNQLPNARRVEEDF